LSDVYKRFENISPLNTSNMSVRIQLDNPPHFYTNLDVVSGRIILNLTSDESVSAITVKLEGESKTVLARPPGGQQNLNPSLVTQRDNRQGEATEIHKLLYKVTQVFPSQNPSSGTTTKVSYMLRSGQHEYPFTFKIPFNNACWDPKFQRLHPESSRGLGFAGQVPHYSHMKSALPPSLAGFPGKAEITYFLKVTVQRPSLFKENRRHEIGFKFMPIEPPRPPSTANEVYARRPYMFQNVPPQMSSTAPRGELDACLPNPAVLTCNKPVPLRLIFRNLNETKQQLYLMFLQMTLIGSTEVRALDVVRVETSSWVIMRLNGLAMPIGSPGDDIRTETVVNKKLWDQIPLPNTVAPSFHTCNLTRSYELEVRVGLGFGTPGNIQVCQASSN
jgi:hypothetical protein